MKKPKEMTYSRISTFLNCPMLEWWRYGVKGVGIEPVTPIIPFIEGSFIHYALHHWYKSKRMQRVNLQKRIEKVIADLKESEGGLTPELDDDLHIRLTAMTGAALSYKQHYHADLEKYEVVYNEEPFQFEFGNFLFRGKIDLLVRDKETDKLELWEHKSAGSIPKDAYAMLPLDLQDFIYCMAVKALTKELPDFKRRNWILKSKLRRKKDRSGGRESLATFEARVGSQYLEEPEKKFFRTPPVKVLKRTVESVEKELAKILTHYEACKDDPFMRFPECVGKYGKGCGFGMACIAKLQGHGDGWDSPETRGMYRLKKALHPELVEEKQEETDSDKSKT